MAIAGLVGCAGGAEAAPIEFTITGTVTSGLDSLGFFGGGDLTGKTFVAHDIITPQIFGYGMLDWYDNPTFASTDMTINNITNDYFDDAFIGPIYVLNGNNIGIEPKIIGIRTCATCTHGFGEDLQFYIKSDLYATEDYLDNPYNGYTLNNLQSSTGTLSYNSEYVGGPAEERIFFSVSSVVFVPLPASAPLFAAALVTLGAIGYGLKRKAA